MSDASHDHWGNLLAIKEQTCERYLVQIRNNHGCKSTPEFTDLANAVSEANELVRFGWSVAIVKRVDTLLELRGADPPTVAKIPNHFR